MVIKGLVGSQFDGLGVVFEGLGDRPVVAVMVGQVVPRGGILRIQLARLLPLDLGRVIFMDVAQKAAVGQARAGVAGVAAEEIFVALFNRREPLPNAGVQGRGPDPGALFGKLLIVSDPPVGFRLGGVILLEQFLVLLFHRIVFVGHNDGNTGSLMNQVADRRGLVGRHQRAQQSDQKVAHAIKLTRPRGDGHGKNPGMPDRQAHKRRSDKMRQKVTKDLPPSARFDSG